MSYEAAGLEVALRDITFDAESSLPPSTVQASCGAAIDGALRSGPYRVAFVAAREPMFWLYEDPSRRLDPEPRIASYPESAPPARFLRLALEQHPDWPSETVHLCCRDDASRAGLLGARDRHGCAHPLGLGRARAGLSAQRCRVADRRCGRRVSRPRDAGIYGWPLDDAIGQALTALRGAETSVVESRLVPFGSDAFDAAERVRASTA